jgi:hypothetical protein
MTTLTRKQLAGLLHAATGNMAKPATAEAGLARLDKLLQARGIDGERPATAAVLVRYADGEATPEATWAALLDLAPKHEAPAVPPSPIIANGRTEEEQAAIEAALAAKPATAIPPKQPKEPKPAPAVTKAAKGAAKPKAGSKPPKASDAAQAPLADARRYRLPAPGTKYRIALNLMRRPGGATNKAICAATGLEGSWTSTGRTMLPPLSGLRTKTAV